jgi:hypothetical protein
MHFRKFGWIYIPVSIAGWILTVLYLGISIYTLVRIGQNYDSLRSSLIRFFPYFISFSVVWFWIAGNTGGKD